MEFMLNFAAILCLSKLVASQSPVVETSLGKIRGSTLKTVNGLDISAFRGIRYAQAPTNDKRFKAPVAVTKWENELDATKDGFLCPQAGVDPALLSEDCLILNVYSRDLSGNKPVIVRIHGGANIAGGSHSVEMEGPQYFMDKEIVLVTLNYRLGALGFLSTRTHEAPGNYAYLDQIMALQWVQDHISRFGGNPDSVTLLGQSAGAMTVTVLMVSPLTKGLFHKAITMSGSASNHYHIDNLFWTQLVARYTSCPMYNPEDVVACLRQVPWQTIIEVCIRFETVTNNVKWNYEIDGHFLKRTPTEAFADGSFYRMPIITGITKDELTFSPYLKEGDTGYFNDISLNFDKYGPEYFMYVPDIGRDSKIQEFYLGNKSINDQDLSNFGKIFADSLISHGVHRLVHLARKYVDVYYYRFDYVGRYSMSLDASGKPRGVSHVDDAQYIFKTKEFEPLAPTDPEWFMVERLVEWFSTFAENGSLKNIGGVEWLPSDSENVYTLYNDKEVRLGEEPYRERLEFWDNLFPLPPSADGIATSYC